MFNLVGKRYLFLLISLIVIIPGVLSLIVKGLNVGIDFAAGSTVEFRTEKSLRLSDVTDALKPFNLSSLQVVSGNNTSVAGNRTIWVRLNTQIDTNVESKITQDLETFYYKDPNSKALSVLFDPLPLLPGGKSATVITITGFPTGATPQIGDIKDKVLNKIDNTTDPTLTPTVAPTPTAQGTGTLGATPKATGTAAVATATAQATATPTVGATATPGSTATAQATSTPTAGKGTTTPSASPTATPTPSLATIPVKVDEVRQGATTQTMKLLTLSTISPTQLHQIEAAFLTGKTSSYVLVLNNASVDPSVAADTTRNAFLAVLAASTLILLYVWFAFRKVAKPWRYGACAIIALLHDVLVVLGVFSILGWALHIQIDALFLTALLTVVGFSVHDTIVVFDRIRENMQRRSTESFEQVVNASLVQTMARSLNTSLTVLFTLSALTLFSGGGSVHNFTLALLIGIFSGTYSSIFNASMLLVIWEKGELGLWRLNRNHTPDGRKTRELVRIRE